MSKHPDDQLYEFKILTTICFPTLNQRRRKLEVKKE